MTDFRFDETVNRDGTGSLKAEMTPPELKAAALPCYWGAEFDFPTCPAFTDGVRKCLDRGYYPFTLQTDIYNDRVCWWMEHVRGWKIQPEWIVPTHGTIFSLATAIRLLVPKGKKLIIIQPGYSRYEQAATRLKRECTHCQMVYDAATNCYSLDRSALENAMADPDNTLLVFSNPNNPTGLILDEDDLRFIDGLSRKYNVPVFCDEIFAEVVRNGARVIPYGEIAGGNSLAITCTSLGKCMSLTGVNHANVLIKNPKLREQFISQRNADHYGSIDPMLHAGLLGAYTQAGKDFIDALNRQIGKNYACFRQRIEAILPGCKVVPCDATFLAWVDYRACGMRPEQLAALLEKALFMGDPGEEYRTEPYFYRYSIAVPMQALQKSMDHLDKTIKKVLL